MIVDLARHRPWGVVQDALDRFVQHAGITQAHLKHGDSTQVHDTRIATLSAQKQTEEASIRSYEKQMETLRAGVFGVMKKGFVRGGLKAKGSTDGDIAKLEEKIKESRGRIEALDGQRITERTSSTVRSAPSSTRRPCYGRKMTVRPPIVLYG